MASPRKATEDSRLTRSAAPAARSPRSVADQSRVDKDGTALSMTERQARIRSEFQQEALPTAPDIPGYHTCWLSSTSSYDPIHKRVRMGYSPVKSNEVTGMESFRMKSGEYEGVIGCNEMLLFKIPTEIYLAIMNEFHHDGPLREEEAIKSQLRLGKEDSNGRDLDEVEGFEDIAVRKRPVFEA